MQRVFLSNNLTVSAAPGRETAVDVLAKNTLTGSFQVKILKALGLLRQLCVFPLLLLFHFGVCGYCGRPLGGIFSILETPERPRGLKMSPQAKECNIDFGLTANKKIKNERTSPFRMLFFRHFL